MRPPSFWSQAPTHPLARLLKPLGAAYGARVAACMDRRGEPAARPVICVGNFTLGGAGKTPTALALAALFAARGLRVAFLSRGYGGRLNGPVRVEPDRHTAADVGDEPLLLARASPTIVAADRRKGAELCVRQGADVIVMDDGLQNPSLTKDLSLAVVDAGAGIGNGLAFPAGPLRAPLVRQWRHVGGLVLIGQGAAGAIVAAQALERGLPVHRSRLMADSRSVAGRRVLAFAGIGRPQKFFDTLREASAVIVETRSFPDHHVYRAAEIEALRRAAERAQAIVVTTEKDRVRLSPALADGIATLPVVLTFEDPTLLMSQLDEVVSSAVR